MLWAAIREDLILHADGLFDPQRWLVSLSEDERCTLLAALTDLRLLDLLTWSAARDLYRRCHRRRCRLCAG